MKKLLISHIVAGLLMGTPMAYADDAHHPEQGGTPASAPDKAMSSSVADAQMAKAQERMKQAQALMARLRESKDPAERKRLMQEHMQAMRDTMGMMRGMRMGMMGGGQGMGMMGGGQGMGTMGSGQGKGPAKTGGMMPMHQMMEDRMEMMQMMMEQMFERQEMLMQDGK
ncbi:MAG: hypothetical protein A2Z65_08030 [Gallionellales bacterium RIFCSPLOWO2_02_58_13]|nr:MAG: hypothetical protein A2Z65_08030 [Gallionellales bacterium RIFCSPLOWO2_02_58_13]